MHQKLVIVTRLSLFLIVNPISKIFCKKTKHFILYTSLQSYKPGITILQTLFQIFTHTLNTLLHLLLSDYAVVRVSMFSDSHT